MRTENWIDLHPKKSKAFLAVLLVVMLALIPACSAASQGQPPTSTPIPTDAPVANQSYPVQRGDVTQSIQFSGRVEPVVQETVFFRVDGRVRSVYVKEGDKVKKSQILADLESLGDLERKQALGKLSVRQAEIQLAMTQLAARAAETGALTKRQLTYEVPQKKFEVELAQIALDKARLNNEDLDAVIAAAQVIAPLDGQVYSSGITAGDMAAAFKPALVVADMASLEVSATVDSTNLVRLQAGMPVIFTFNNRPGKEFAGKIRRLPASSSTSATQDKSTDKLVRISFATAPNDLVVTIGDILQVNVILQKKEGVLRLPPKVVRTFQGRRFVIVQDDQGMHRVDVKVGIQGDDRLEIVDGLSEGQVVASP